MKRKVLFLCTGNSCRSQMAEAIVNARLGDVWEAYSAGTQPAGYVHPLALRALAEIGIQHGGRSKHADEYRSVPFDLVVTVCDDAAENCPVWLGQGKRVHLGSPIRQGRLAQRMKSWLRSAGYATISRSRRLPC